jgi:hypothetical protein
MTTIKMTDSYEYSSITNFGRNNSNEGADLYYCLVDDMETSLMKGSSNKTSPSSQNCQALTAERCANEWDTYCDVYYENNKFNSLKGMPNLTNNFLQNTNNFSGNATLGDSLLNNAAQLRFYDNSHLKTFTEPLDPTSASSPLITKYVYENDFNRPRINSKVLNSRDIDNDKIINKLLQDPLTHYDFLQNLFVHLSVYKTHDTLLPTTRTFSLLSKYFN